MGRFSNPILLVTVATECKTGP